MKTHKELSKIDSTSLPQEQIEKPHQKIRKLIDFEWTSINARYFDSAEKQDKFEASEESNQTRRI